MPGDYSRLNVSTPRPFAYSGKNAVNSPANGSPSVRELLARNGILARQNRQLTLALARLTTDASIMIARLTPRQQQVIALVLQGHPSKNIAADLRISQRTVENHRAAIMRRTGAASLPELVRLSLGVV